MKTLNINEGRLKSPNDSKKYVPLPRSSPRLLPCFSPYSSPLRLISSIVALLLLSKRQTSRCVKCRCINLLPKQYNSEFDFPDPYYILNSTRPNKCGEWI